VLASPLSADYGQIWRHPRKRKYVTYCIVVRRRPSHGHINYHVQKISCMRPDRCDLEWGLSSDLYFCNIINVLLAAKSCNLHSALTSNGRGITLRHVRRLRCSRYADRKILSSSVPIHLRHSLQICKSQYIQSKLTSFRVESTEE